MGTSGWQYRDWRGGFYPERMPQREWLDHYVAHFQCVEVNNTFYRLPREEVFEQWRSRAPRGFSFGLKLSRYLSHIKRLQDPAGSVALFLDRATRLGDRIGPLLLQLPPNFEVDTQRLRDALAAIPSHLRVAVEFRHASWFREDVAELLRARDVPLCLTDRLEHLQEPAWQTASWGYIRFHQGCADPWPSYRPRCLHAWAERLASMWGRDADVYAFFNNDPHGAAVRDAVVFAERCRAVGLTPTRVPNLDDVRLTA